MKRSCADCLLRSSSFPRCALITYLLAKSNNPVCKLYIVMMRMSRMIRMRKKKLSSNIETSQQLNHDQQMYDDYDEIMSRVTEAL